jgi:oxepin-CoA hydrolase/3-oxo-5,6-dehydrosuberyl-CoA semialdehyde dehydrogenase
LKTRLGSLVIGDPAQEGVTMGALASSDQCREVRERIEQIARSSEIVYDGSVDIELPAQGAYLAPVLLYCDRPLESSEVHDVEAFGPVTTVIPYDDAAQAIEIANRGQGSLVGSLFTYDNAFAREMVLGIGAWHGRILIGNRDCAAESTGHGSPLPALIHGGPGRAGGGQEMGGVRGVLHYMQCTALQGSPTTLSAVGGRWVTGARRNEDSVHPFRKTLAELEIGDSIVTARRRITLADIEHFAEFSGDRFYAHMDEEAARANPFFEGRVAHGYFIVSAAAGLFVDPAPGPVLANYGLENLRFLTPLNPDDEIRVQFTCKQKIPRETEDYGEVRWDTQVMNQHGELVATYDVLTLVAKG